MIRILYITSLFLLFGCSSEKTSSREYVFLQGRTMGTSYSVKYFDEKERDFQSSIDSLLEVYNLIVSTYIPESEISRFNSSKEEWMASQEFLSIIKHAKQIHSKTEGAFDPTVMPLVNAWGFGYQKKGEIPSSKEIDSIMTFVGFDKILVKQNKVSKLIDDVQLDLSAIAKGRGVDLVAEFLINKGITDCFVEIGGEVVCKGKNPKGSNWKIGIEDPTTVQQSLHKVTSLENRAMATSGNYRNFRIENGKKYAHTIDPVSGKAVQHSLLSASIKAPTCEMADAYATASMVMGVEKAFQLISKISELEGYFIYDEVGELQVKHTPGFFDGK